MTQSKTWKEESLDLLTQQRETVHKNDQAFYQFNRFEEIIGRLDEFAENCAECRDLQTEMTAYLPKVSEWINGGAKGKRQYEKLQEKQLKHLKEAHGIYPYSYHVSRYSFIGILAGLVAGFAFASIFTQYFHPMWISFTIAGMIISNIIGTRKDMKLRRLKKVI